MPSKRKIIFIIVEGISDQTALAAIMSKLVRTENVIVEFTRGDITTEFGVSPSNIASKVGNFIKDYSKPYSYKASDYLEVIHIIDTDGAFIGNDKVLEASVEETLYDCDSIKTPNCQKIIDRNQRKVENVKRLISLSKVWVSIPYSVYFFSCNLDHVLYDNANVPWEDKDRLATEFAKQYRYHPENFLTFIQDNTFAIKKTYIDSWKHIEEGENSLKRYTNINLVFSEQAKNIKRALIQI